jgi:hypothetical protein
MLTKKSISFIFSTKILSALLYRQRLDYPNNIWQGVYVTKLLMRHAFLSSPYFLPLRPKYLPQHDIPTLLCASFSVTEIWLELTGWKWVVFILIRRWGTTWETERTEEGKTPRKKGGKKEGRKERYKESQYLFSLTSLNPVIAGMVQSP